MINWIKEGELLLTTAYAIRDSPEEFVNLLQKLKKLVDFAMQADEYTHYFQTITSILGRPVAIVTSEGQTLYNVISCSETELLSDWPWHQDHRFYKAANNLLYRAHLLKNGKSYGYLLVQTENLLEAHDMEGIFHQAAVILSYHLEVIRNQKHLRQAVALE